MCKICEHPNRLAIEDHYLSHKGLRDTARKFECSTNTLRRHLLKHVGKDLHVDRKISSHDEPAVVQLCDLQRAPVDDLPPIVVDDDDPTDQPHALAAQPLPKRQTLPEYLRTILRRAELVYREARAISRAEGETASTRILALRLCLQTVDPLVRIAEMVERESVRQREAAREAGSDQELLAAVKKLRELGALPEEEVSCVGASSDGEQIESRTRPATPGAARTEPPAGRS